MYQRKVNAHGVMALDVGHTMTKTEVYTREYVPIAMVLDGEVVIKWITNAFDKKTAKDELFYIIAKQLF